MPVGVLRFFKCSFVSIRSFPFVPFHSFLSIRSFPFVPSGLQPEGVKYEDFQSGKDFSSNVSGVSVLCVMVVKAEY